MQFGVSHPADLTGRLSALGLVAALHVLIVLGFSAGLIHQRLQAPLPPPQLDIVKSEPPPVELPVAMPAQDAPQRPSLPPMPIPDVVQSAEASPISVRAAEPGESWRDAPIGTAASANVAEPTLPQASAPLAAGLLCPTQTRPELPALAQSGSAHLRVLGTVRGGRVVAVQMQVLQALPDRRAQRALLQGVEQTLRGGYACTQDGQFEQEFLFRVVE